MKDSFIQSEDVNELINSIENPDKPTTTDGHANISAKHKTGEVPYRFVVLVGYCLLTFSNGMQWVTFSPISDSLVTHYGVSEVGVDMFSLLYMIVYPFVNFPCSYLIDKVSMRMSMAIAGVGTVLAAAIKTLLNVSFFYAYVGQTIASIVQPLIINSCGKISALWFRPKIRVLITSIACLSNVVGISFGYLFPGFIFPSESSTEEYKRLMVYYLLIVCSMNFVLCIPSIFLMKSKPPIPSSHSQEIAEDTNFTESLKKLCTNGNFISLTLAYTFMVGYYNLYGTKINEIFLKYSGINFSEVGFISSLSNVFGVSSALFFSVYLDIYKTYKQAFILLCSISVIAQLLMSVLAELYEEQCYYIFLIGYIVVEMCVVPVYSISFDYVIELTYPIGESISGGIIMTASQISGIAVILLIDLTMHNEKLPRILPNLASAGLLIVAFVSLLFVKGILLLNLDDLRRNAVEEEK